MPLTIDEISSIFKRQLAKLEDSDTIEVKAETIFQLGEICDVLEKDHWRHQ